MTTDTECIAAADQAQLRSELLGQLASQQGAEFWRRPRILRAEVKLQEMDLPAWLSAQSAHSRGYWSDREQRFELGGVGKADMLTGEDLGDYDALMTRLHERIDELPYRVRYFGGMRFSAPAKPAPQWRRFQAYRFILPRFELLQRDGTMTFACNMMSNEELATVGTEWDNLHWAVSAQSLRLPGMLERRNRPECQAWNESVLDALANINAGHYEKVVLAREVRLTFEAAVNPAVLLRELKARTGDRFFFCFQPGPDVSFVGASPERLYRRDGRAVRTEAIAGTRRRGAGDAEDTRLERELLTSVKERREQGYVVDALAEALGKLCVRVTHDEEPAVLKLSAGQHLITHFEGELQSDVTDGRILRSLHPTPAVGGFPPEPALADIRRLEPFDRGWYAGPVGWIARDSAQFAVGIRSALVNQEQVRLYSGAGIVDGSVPEEEWEEVENKILDYLGILNGS